MGKLIALDIDGTLYTDEKRMSPQTVQALLRAQEGGCILVLASGRPKAGLVPIARQLQMERYGGYLLAYNGGAVTACANGEVIAGRTIPLALAKGFLRHLEGFPVTPIVDDGREIFTNDADGFNIGYERQTNHLGVRLVENISDALDFAPPKILVAAAEPVLTPNIPGITLPFEGQLHFVRSAPFYLEATPPGVDKAASLAAILDRLGLQNADLIAFGDAENDVSMCRLAGVGVAMGNACDELKAVADLVTSTNNEDGIAQALHQLGLCARD